MNIPIPSSGYLLFEDLTVVMYQQHVCPNMFCFVIVASAEVLISQVPYCNKAGAPLCIATSGPADVKGAKHM